MLTRWHSQPDDYYLVTGIKRDGRRFSMKFKHWEHAKAINLWRGSVWLWRYDEEGKRKRRLVKRVSN